MNCEHALRVLDAGLDDELDRATMIELDGHLAGCAACAAHRGDREALRQALRGAPRHAPPARLRPAIVEAIAKKADAPRRPARRGLSWASAAALAGVAALTAFLLGWWIALPPMDNGPRAELVSRHAGSLAVGGRLYDIASSDRHVLKPWFAGKVDFAPPVRDLSPSGFSLVGARLDQIGGRPVAVVVYRIRRHDISLFVSRSASSLPQPLTLGRPLGFALATWAEDGLSFDAVSDVDPQELARFATLIRTQGL